MKQEQLMRCLTGLFEGLLWLFLPIIAALGCFLLDIGLIGTGWLMMLGAVWLAACAFRSRR